MRPSQRSTPIAAIAAAATALVCVVAVVMRGVSACSDDYGPAVCPGDNAQHLGVYIEYNTSIYEVMYVPHHCVSLGCVSVAGKVRCC